MTFNVTDLFSPWIIKFLKKIVPLFNALTELMDGETFLYNIKGLLLISEHGIITYLFIISLISIFFYKLSLLSSIPRLAPFTTTCQKNEYYNIQTLQDEIFSDDMYSRDSILPMTFNHPSNKMWKSELQKSLNDMNSRMLYWQILLTKNN